MILISLLPVIIEVYRGRKHKNQDEGVVESTIEQMAHDVEEV